jgi:curved DNA-binding protein
MQFRDYYETLGVERSSTQDEIKKAYRKLSRQFHPDVNKDKGAEDRFKQVGEAYEVLKDPDKRRQYDQIGSGYTSGQDFRPPAGWQNVDFNFTGTPTGAGGGVPSGFSDFFEAFFAGGEGRRRAPRPREGADVEAEITISIEEAYAGTSRTITMQHTVPGHDGGRRSEDRTFTVKIPAGATEGSRVRLRGLGGKGSGGAPDGDVIVTIHIAEHERFVLEDRDIVTRLFLSPWEAALGGKVPLQTLGGEVKLTIPPGAPSGMRMRLKGKGLPKKDNPGDLIVELNIVVPTTLTDAERKLFEELSKISRFDPRAAKA